MKKIFESEPGCRGQGSSSAPEAPMLMLTRANNPEDPGGDQGQGRSDSWARCPRLSHLSWDGSKPRAKVDGEWRPQQTNNGEDKA